MKISMAKYRNNIRCENIYLNHKKNSNVEASKLLGSKAILIIKCMVLLKLFYKNNRSINGSTNIFGD